MKKIIIATILVGLASNIAHAETKIVAFGTSFTGGYGVGRERAYPALLEQALRAKGYDVTVSNAGVYGDTAAGRSFTRQQRSSERHSLGDRRIRGQ